MFAQLGSVQFDGLQTFVSYSTAEELTLAEFALIGRKPRLMAAAIGLSTISLSIFLHVEFTPGSVEDEISKLRTSLESFEILPLLWGNGETAGEYIIKELEVEYTNLDTLGNVYEARVNLSLIESVEDNKDLQEKQSAAKNAFATGDKRPATKSKRQNPTSCQKKISALIQEIQQFGTVVNQIVPVYTGDQKQAAIVARACTSISEDCDSIESAVNTTGSCVFNNTDLLSWSNSVKVSAVNLRKDITLNSQVVNNIDTSEPAPDGHKVSGDNNNLQIGIKALVSTGREITKAAIVQ